MDPVFLTLTQLYQVRSAAKQTDMGTTSKTKKHPLVDLPAHVLAKVLRWGDGMTCEDRVRVAVGGTAGDS